ncbi:hypothetical protein C8R43DRAFT_1034015 [Mycena crocata]|nr:hypothetical protein C8R43DRAFT_1034015 [Mycena crocata]
MLIASSFAILLSAAVVASGAHHQPEARGHSAIGKRTFTANSTSIEKRESFENKYMTWYPTDTGADACTGKNHKDSDWYVAMGYDQFGDGSACCGKKLRITYNGKSTVATCLRSDTP